MNLIALGLHRPCPWEQKDYDYDADISYIERGRDNAACTQGHWTASRCGIYYRVKTKDESNKKTLRQQAYVKESLERAFDEMKQARREERKLQSADDFIKEQRWNLQRDG